MLLLFLGWLQLQVVEPLRGRVGWGWLQLSKVLQVQNHQEHFKNQNHQINRYSAKRREEWRKLLNAVFCRNVKTNKHVLSSGTPSALTSNHASAAEVLCSRL